MSMREERDAQGFIAVNAYDGAQLRVDVSDIGKMRLHDGVTASVQWPRVRGNQVVRDEFNRPEWAEVKQKLEALNQADLSQLVASKEEHMMRKILDVFRLLLCANSRMTCYNEMLTALLRCNSRHPTCSQFSRCSTVYLV